MDGILKHKWLVALRSGEYKQGTGCLYDEQNQAYCCLGVLLSVVGYKKEHFMGHGLSSSYLFSQNKEKLLPDAIESILARMNDNGTKFDVIADHIEKHG